MMAALRFIKRLWQYLFEELSLWGKILSLPSMIFMFSTLFLMGIVELFLLDLWFIPLTAIEFKTSIKQAIKYFNYI